MLVWCMIYIKLAMQGIRATLNLLAIFNTLLISINLLREVDGNALNTMEWLTACPLVYDEMGWWDGCLRY